MSDDHFWGCWFLGPEHHDCARARITALEQIADHWKEKFEEGLAAWKANNAYHAKLIEDLKAPK